MPRVHPPVEVTYRVQLVCNHVLTFTDHPPRKGEVLWCSRCQEERRALAAPPELRARCQGCRYSRRFGRDRASAERAIARHREKQPTHVMELRDGRVLLDTFGDMLQTALFGPPQPQDGHTAPF